jgi:hypothetical protein|tara:strand:+ start:1035 stop:1865 length:831 start_codon:yes stop_codon:yes gene_type:complete
MTTDTETHVEETPLIKPRPYMGNDRLDALEPDEKVATPEVDDEEVNDLTELPAEEKTFRKRYGDLRRHSQAQEAALQDEIATLKKEREELSKVERPLDDEALDAFREENPEASDIFESIAQREVEKARKENNDLRDELNDAKEKSAIEKAKIVILGRHADFDDIVDSDVFHDWAETKSAAFQRGIYKNPDDGEWAADIIDAFKTETDFGSPSKPSRKQKMQNSAAELVDIKGKSAPDFKEKPTFTRSQIGAMSLKDYEKNEDAILLAREEGRILDE